MSVQSEKYFWPGWSLTYKPVRSAEPNKIFWTMFWKHLKSNSRAFFLWNIVFHLEGNRVPHSIMLCHLMSNAVLCPDASQKQQSQEVPSGKRTLFSQTCPLGGHLLGLGVFFPFFNQRRCSSHMLALLLVSSAALLWLLSHDLILSFKAGWGFSSSCYHLFSLLPLSSYPSFLTLSLKCLGWYVLFGVFFPPASKFFSSCLFRVLSAERVCCLWLCSWGYSLASDISALLLYTTRASVLAASCWARITSKSFTRLNITSIFNLYWFRRI